MLENERRSYIHQCADAFVLVLLTHGSRGSVFGIDGEKVPIDEITTLFDGSHCPQLRNKPKLFFVQACQGRELSLSADSLFWPLLIPYSFYMRYCRNQLQYQLMSPRRNTKVTTAALMHSYEKTVQF